MGRKPRILVASTWEASREVADGLCANLSKFAEVTMWDEGLFVTGEYFLHSLARQAAATDFIVTILSPDDEATSRGSTHPAPRDNLIFELGLFLGIKGRGRVFAVVPGNQPIKLPSDMNGITYATYEATRSDGNWESATRTASYSIRKAVEKVPGMDSPIPTVVELQDRISRDGHLGHPVNRIKSARKEVWVSGTTMDIAGSGVWRGMERSDAQLKFLLPDHRLDWVVEATRRLDAMSANRQREMFIRSIEYLRSVSTNAGPAEVRLLAYSPSYSVFAVDPLDDGFMSIELTGHGYEPHDTPNFTLRATAASTRSTFEFFRTAWSDMWSEAKPAD